jgi:hypothetical protein
MTTKTIDCIDCGQSVPYGRLSCPACGALLASVAGALRSPVYVVEGEAPPEPESQLAPEPESGDEAGADLDPIEEHEPAAEAEPDAELQPAAIDKPDPDAEPERAAEPEPIAAAVETPPIDEPPDRSPWPPITEAEPTLEPRPYMRRVPSARDGVATSPAAYRPPSLSLAAASASGAAWPSVGPTPFGGSGRTVATDIPAQPKAADPAEPSVADRSIELAGWIVVAGAAMSILGFALPWARVVIGAANTGGYFDSWGLASPTHVLVLAGLLVVLGLGVVRTAVPVWIRTGVLGLAAGGLLVGLAWPYIVGRLGADVGVILALIGGIALVVGGVIASWATRHVREEPSV